MKSLNYLITALSLSLAFYSCTAQQQASLEIPLDGPSKVKIEGPHRFVTIAGIKGLNVTSLKTQAYFETTVLEQEKVTLSLWMSPLETLDKSPASGGSSLVYSLLSDRFPPMNIDSSNFSLYYAGSHYPRVIGRFTSGSYWGKMDYGIAPVVYAEALPLEKGQWYNIVMTWDKPGQKMAMYINGELVGHNLLAKDFMIAGKRIYIGNPIMVISKLSIAPGIMDKEAVRKEYIASRPSTNQSSENTIKSLVLPTANPLPAIVSDKNWKKVYQCDFDKESDLEKWTFQTGDKYKHLFKLQVTDDGLLWQTPDIIDTESRGYLWCPFKAEGDQCIEYEFQLISPKGLSLVIMCATGMLGEDIIEDQGLRKTGSMSDMNKNYRNYHWEYVRRVEAMRTDVETQYVNKNPWGRSLYVGCVPRLEQNKWIKVRFIKAGNKLYGTFDDKLVFETEDNNDNNGPVLNSGRVVLRQMYHTTMKYRNFAIYQK